MSPQRAVSETTWGDLVRASAVSVADGWASRGVFAAAVGPDYEVGSRDALLYVGKSGGPLIDSVGLCDDQVESSNATRRWMVERRNPSSPFWVFADLLAPRESLAWSNLAKIDTRRDGPPGARQWKSIEEVCLRALEEEMRSLAPGKTVFAISGYQADSVGSLLRKLGFTEQCPASDLDSTIVFVDASGRLAVITRHPQGWACEARDPVAQFIQEWPRPDSCAA